MAVFWSNVSRWVCIQLILGICPVFDSIGLFGNKSYHLPFNTVFLQYNTCITIYMPIKLWISIWMKNNQNYKSTRRGLCYYLVRGSCCVTIVFLFYFNYFIFILTCDIILAPISLFCHTNYFDNYKYTYFIWIILKFEIFFNFLLYQSFNTDNSSHILISWVTLPLLFRGYTSLFYTRTTQTAWRQAA